MQQLKERATIGHTITVKGDISGEEDLIVHGKVEGKIRLQNNNVMVGESGRIKADVVAKVVSVEGTVEGNLAGQEKVVVRKSGTIHGNISAPRVTLEDGCKFTGSIDMEGGSKGLASSPQLKRPERAHEPKIVSGKS